MLELFVVEVAVMIQLVDFVVLEYHRLLLVVDDRDQILLGVKVVGLDLVVVIVIFDADLFAVMVVVAEEMMDVLVVE